MITCRYCSARFDPAGRAYDDDYPHCDPARYGPANGDGES